MFPLRFSRLARCICALVLTLCSQVAMAQEPNPGIVEFTPSPDHGAATSAGVPLVDQYIMTLYRVGQATALESLGIGKPAVDRDGMIRVDVQSFLFSKLVRGVSYQARVAASGPGGVGASELSNEFQLGACSTVLSQTSVQLDANGGGTTLTVASSAGCTWTAASGVPWILVTTGASGTGTGTVILNTQPNPLLTARNGTVTIGAQAFTVSQAGSSCTTTLSRTSFDVVPAGGSGSVAVTSQAGCTWTAGSNDSWLTLTGGASGTGSGTVSFSAAPNTTDKLRSGLLTIGGQPFTVRQDTGVCSFALASPADTAFAQVAVSGASLYTWEVSSSDPRAMTRVALGSRVKSAWYGATFSLDINITDALPHQVAIYVADYDSANRQQRFDVRDAQGTLLDSRTVSGFDGGQYLVWTMQGRVSVQVTSLGGPNALVSGVLVGPGAGTSGAGSTSATFVKTDLSTQGTWHGVYGQRGFAIADDAASQWLPATATASSVMVTGPGACAWTATSQDSWLTVTSGQVTGEGRALFTAAANQGADRSTIISVGNQTFTIAQAGKSGPSCSSSVSPTSLPIAASAGSAAIAVTSGCAWTATSSAAWLTITTGTSGTGNGSVTVTATANPGSTPRAATLTIAGQTVTVTQAGAQLPCTFGLSTTAQAFTSAVSSASVTVSSAAGCAWTATSNAAWLTVTAGASGAGPGTVSFSATANTGPANRVGTLTIAGQSVTVTQAAVTCAPTLSSTSQALGTTGGAGSVTVSSGASCAWTASSNAAWLTVTGGASGTGTGPVSFSATPNSGSADRWTTLTIAGQTFTVTQASTSTVCEVTLASPAATPFAQVTVRGEALYTWDAASSDLRATERSGAGRVMAAWYGQGFALDINIADAQPHQVAIYVADYDPWEREQRFDVRDAQGALLDTRTVSGFSGGQYLVWTMQGRVTVEVTSLSGPNAVVSGVFIGPGTGAGVAGSGSATFVKADLTTQGAWRGVYGALGFAIADDVTSQWLPAAATASSVDVRSQSACAWTATSQAAWLTVTAPGTGTGGGSVAFSAAANTGAARSTTLSVAGQTFTIAQGGGSAPPCTSTVSPSSVPLVAAGGAATLAVSSGCAWTATSSATWLTITSGASGTGGGTVAVAATANTTPTPRTATLTIAGQTVTVTQAGLACTYAVSATTQSFAAAAASGNVTVNGPTGCAWSATSGAAWLTVTAGASGTGLGTASFNVAANTATTQRTGTLTVAGQTVTVTQAGVACSYSLSASGQAVAFGGGAGSVGVTGPSGCGWTAASSASWLTVSSGASGTGNGTVAFSAAANAGLLRTATLTVADKVFTVTQAAAVTCTVTLTQSARSVNKKKTTGSFGVTPTAGCAWTAVSSDSWLQVTANTSTGVVSYNVAAHSGSATRVATITVGNLVFTLTQRADGAPNAPDGLRVVSGG